MFFLDKYYISKFKNEVVLAKCINEKDEVQVIGWTITEIYMSEIMDGIWLLPHLLRPFSSFSSLF